MFDIGDTVGSYRITGILGSGGMGSVYRGEHTITRRNEAIKIAARGRPASEAEEQRFLREVQVQASLTHPNIAAVHNAFWEGGDLVLVMELIEGTPLSDMIDRTGVKPAKGLEYVSQVLSALEYAHARGIVHRDVTPGNIIIAADGTVKLTDFGLARPKRDSKLTQSGVFVGSPSYASPEQVRGDRDPDERSDLYSVGVVLYELLTGKRPFTGAGAFDVMMAHTSPDPPRPPIELNPAIGPEMNAVVLRALDKEPARRFQSAGEFRAALLAAMRGVTFHRPWTSVATAVARSRTAGLAIGLGAGVLAIMAAGLWFGRPDLGEPPPHYKSAAPAAPPAVSQAQPATAPPITSPPAEAAEQPPPEPALEKATAAQPAPKPPARRTPTARAVESSTKPSPMPPAEPAVESAANTAAPSDENRNPNATAAVAEKPSPMPPVAQVAAATVEPAKQQPIETVKADEKRRHPVVRALGKVFFRPFKRKKAEETTETPNP